MLNYPNKSHRKPIIIPQNSVKLAELIGIILGDGGINNDWQLVITLNSIADLEYSKYVRSLIMDLFHIDVAVRKRSNSNALTLVCSSMNLLDFLVSKGAVRGDKIKNKIDIPDWIKQEPEYKTAFIRGLVDTDGCVYIHKHSVMGKEYANLGLCFTNFSPRLIESVFKIFQERDLVSYVVQNGTRLYIYKQASVFRYLREFGSSNLRITKKLKEWEMVIK